MHAKLAGAMLVALAGAAMAAAPALEEGLMETIEVVAESLSSNIGLQDAAAARTDAGDLAALFTEVEAYFTRLGDAKDGVEHSKKSRLLSAEVLAAVDQGRFADAANAASEIGRTCKACHRRYKP